MSFSKETEKESKLPFLAVEILHEQGKFTTIVYRKPSFLPTVYKFGMVYTLVFLHLLKLDTIPYRINFCKRNIS